MKYRRFGKLDWNVSVLGFGAMRMPITGNDAANINETEAIEMIRFAIDHGVNYIDTAYPYHKGSSEPLVRKALLDGYRDKVKLATKMPTWLVNSIQDMDKFLEEQLARLQMDHVDFYLLHGLGNERWQTLSKLGVMEWAEKKMAEGKFDHLGFSFHDDYSVFKKIIDDYDGWAMCQILYNYADRDYQAGMQGLRYAASKGLAVVVMEPIAGGRLAIKPQEEIQAIWDEADVKRTPAEWALLWVWNQPEVTIALSGMSTLDQVRENVKVADCSAPGMLSEKELGLIKRVEEKYKKSGFVPCTGCNYCLPCPEGVNIPKINSFYNEFYVKGRDEALKKRYWEYITPESQARRCVRCGKCEELCPRQLPVREILSRAAMIFEQKT